MQSPLSKTAAIVGAYEDPRRTAPEMTDWSWTAEVVTKALDDAGLTKADVDGFMTAGNSETGYLTGPGSTLMCDYLNIRPDFIDDTDLGGTTYGFQLDRAVMAINAGLCNVVVISYAGCLRSGRYRIGTRGFGELRPQPLRPYPDSFYEPFGTMVIGQVAMTTRLQMEHWGLTREALAAVAVSARRYAEMNPDAMFRTPIDIDDVLTSPMIADPIRKLDCCGISDGAGAIVVTSADRAKDCKKPPVYVLGFGEALDNTRGGHTDWVGDGYEMNKIAADKAFAMADVGRQEIDVATFYDAFTIMVIQQLESLGFVPIGEGGAFVQDGEIDLNGRLPVNPDGGGLSSNHPGRRGLFLLIEAVRQLRAECGPRQVSDAKLALVSAVGSAYMALQGNAIQILGVD